MASQITQTRIEPSQITQTQKTELEEIKRKSQYELLLKAIKEEVYNNTKKEWLDDLNKPQGNFAKLLETLATKTYEQSVIYSKITTEKIRRSTLSPSRTVFRFVLQMVKYIILLLLLGGGLHVVGLNPLTWETVDKNCLQWGIHSWIYPSCYGSWLKEKTRKIALTGGEVFGLFTLYTIVLYVFQLIEKHFDELEKRISIEAKENALSQEFIKHVKNSIGSQLKDALSHVFLLDHSHETELAVIIKYGSLKHNIVDIEQYRQCLFYKLESQYDAKKAAMCFAKTFPQELMGLLTDLAKEKEEWLAARDKLIIQAHVEFEEGLNYISKFGSSIASEFLGMTGPAGKIVVGQLNVK